MTELSITGLTLDSRLIEPGMVFVAVPGDKMDGRLFIPEAIQKGASAILVCRGRSPCRPKKSPLAPLFQSGELEENPYTNGIPIIEIPDLKNTLGFIASRFFNDPSHTLPVVGITGTNGKTSCSHFFAQILNFCGKTGGILGTLGVGFPNKLQAIPLTTPDAITVHRYLANLRDEKAFAVAMEVSSHALTQGRVNGVQFHTAIFTNLTRDHLDYHGDMHQYWEAKKKLFLEHDPKFAIINLDDLYGLKLVDELVKKQRIPVENIIGYSIDIKIPPNPPFSKWGIEENGSSFVSGNSLVPHFEKGGLGGISLITTHNIRLDDTGIHATIQTPWGNGELHSSLLGQFNLSNILAALAAACVQGVPFDGALEAVKHLIPVAGRMNCLGGKAGEPLIVIDYAHTPDALQNVLMALRSHCRGKLWCIFGCGGDRDRGKRPLMAQIAEKYSDKLIITQDNSRTEDPKQIFADMVKGLNKPNSVQIESDRIQAIMQSIEAAAPSDLILIAGKGHENYQIVGTEKIPLDDYAEAKKALHSRREQCT